MKTLLHILTLTFLLLHSCTNNSAPDSYMSGEAATQKESMPTVEKLETIEFDLGTINFDNLPQNLQLQVEGAGCSYSFTKEGLPFMLNGLIRVNGVYEMLESQESSMDDLMIYENKHWIIRIKNDPSRSSDGEGESRGTMTLRSKQSDEAMTKRVYGFCGC